MRRPVLVGAVVVTLLVLGCFQFLHLPDKPAAGLPGGLHHGRQPQPTAALLFLTRGPMPLEPAWREFFEATAGLRVQNTDTLLQRLKHSEEQLDKPYTVPPFTNTAVKATGAVLLPSNSSFRRRHLPEVLAERRRGRQLQAARPFRSWSKLAAAADSPIAKQGLFSVYVHPAPGYSYAPGNTFAGYEIPQRVQAERLLLKQALTDAGNQRFVLLSESCLPLYPPAMLYAQLLGQPLSRVHACAAPTMSDEKRRLMYRWNWAMATDRFTDEQWRKSSQWSVLIRSHAQLVMQDREIESIFAAQCFTYLPTVKLALPAHVQRLLDQGVLTNSSRRTCVSDEHYIPSLLAVHGLDAQTDCVGTATFGDWAYPNWSPKAYAWHEITPTLLQSMRSKAWLQPPDMTCNYTVAMASTPGLYWPRPSEAVQGEWGHLTLLPPYCSLFARKFGPDAVDAVVTLGQDCERGFAWSPACASA